jgi:hypothetical protein
MTNPSTRQRPEIRRTRPSHDATVRTPAEPAPVPAPYGSDARIAAGLNVIAGIWLIIAPFVLGYGDGDPYWNDIVFGALIAAVAALRFAVAPKLPWLSGLTMLFGAWVFASAFWLDATSTASWNDGIVGAIVFLLGAAAAFSGSRSGAARL